MKRIVLTLLTLFTLVAVGWAQRTGEIQGRVVDQNGEGIPFANVVIFQNDVQVNGASTDFDGYFQIKPLNPGTYKVTSSYIGKTVNVTGVTVAAQKTTFLDDIVINTAQELQVVEVVYEEPPVDVGKPEVGTSISREQIEKMPKNNLVGMLGNAAATYQSDDNNLISIAGSRGYGTKYLIDGVDLTGIVDLPPDAIDQMQVITSGVDASQGDFTGGVVSISTRGPSKNLSGSMEVLSSQFTDPFGYNQARFSLLGPIWTKNKGTDTARTKIGFLLAGDFKHEKDDDPQALDVYVVKDDVLADLKERPLVPSDIGAGFNKTSEFVSLDDMRVQQYRPNTDGWRANVYGKLDIKPSETTNLTIGGNYLYGDDNATVGTFQMFNYENNPKVYDQDIRAYMRFTQRFPSKPQTERKEGFVLGNAFYSLQVDFQKRLQQVHDRNHIEKPFQYGYIGNFNTELQPVYFYSQDSVTGYDGFRLLGYQESGVSYESGTANPVLARYNETIFESQEISSLNSLPSLGGFRNGDFLQPLFSYSIWYNPGVPYTSYSRSNNEQFGVRFDASFSLRKTSGAEITQHSIEFGFEYQQRTERGYNASPYGLWGLARQLTNFHLTNLDVANPYFIVDGQRIPYDEFNGTLGEFDTISYDRLYVQGDQSYFDIQLRRKLGLPVDGLDFIDLDAVDPDMLTLDMFSPDELLNNSNRRVSNRGYDYYGNLITGGQPAFSDFFYKYDDLNGNGERDFDEPYTRDLAAYQPIYTAAYIQDRFNIGQVIFRLGLRVDRFDANQKVLRDRYSLYAIRSVEEVTTIGGQSVVHPDVIGNDYAVYVNDVQNPTSIVGYRDGDIWYDSEGNELQDPQVLVQGTGGSGRIAPYLVDPSQDIKQSTFDVDQSFEDYTPQFTAMPRIAFSFPITDLAMFTAHYDVLTQRPLGNNEATPYHYYYLQEIAIDGVIPNPNLRPEKTINYQVGFQQALSDDSRISISAFYREMRDMMQVQRVNFAYPIEYTTFGNVDFGTVKGLVVSYDLIRRVNNMLLNASYTLQFADGTGSGSTSQINLVSAGQPNLRTIVPLSNDVRHTFNVNLDYRFGEGDFYNGPKIGGRDILANAGINLALRARSGEPYTRQGNPTPTAQFGVRTSSNLVGTINGSRLPFNFKMDLRIDKDFVINTGKKKLYLNVYVVSQNVLNTRNVIGVYRYTGSATDDGFLDAPSSQETINAQVDPEAFYDQYWVRVNNPNNYSLPRRTQIGLRLRF